MYSIEIKEEGKSFVSKELPDTLCIRILGMLANSGPLEQAEGYDSNGIDVKGKPKQQVRLCGVCRKPSHQSRTCKENTPKNYYMGDDKEEDNDEDFMITTTIKNEISEMLLSGQGSHEIAAYYGISVKLANNAIAQAKGIKLPK